MPARVRIPAGRRGALSGSVPVVTDPDILERALLFAALARGPSMCRIAQAPASLAPALQVLAALGVESTELKPGVYRIEGSGRMGLRAPRDPLDARGVPVLARGLLGVLAAQPFPSRLGPFEAPAALAADLELLRARGADAGVIDGGEAALGAHTGPLAGQAVALPEPAPLTKHVVLMAGLYSDQMTTISEPLISADHTERMLDALGAPIRAVGSLVSLVPRGSIEVQPFEFDAPGSLSAGAYLVAAAAVVPGSHVTLRDVTLNPTRSGFLEALRTLGAQVGITPKSVSLGEASGEVSFRYRTLTGGKIGGEPVLRLDHQAHALAVVAAHASGETRLSDLGHVLSDSEVAKLVGFLRSFGVQAESASDTVHISGSGGRPFSASRVTTGGDPRLAAMGVLLGLGAEGESVIDDVDSLAEFLPRFVGTLRALGAKMEVET